VNRVIIGSLNVNSLPNKFEQLKEIIGKNLDILTIQETKLDSSFPPQQFIIEGYSEPYRLDRNRDGGGVLVYVREDMPSKLLSKHNFSLSVEGMFIEINLRKTKLLFFGGYRSEHLEYGLSKSDFLEQLQFGLDKYSGYEKVLIAGDFNIDINEEILEEFLFEQNLRNLVKQPTCYKNVDNPSCIDLFLTNSSLSFQHTTTVETGLSDFHKMAVTVMKTTFPKAQPKIIYYRDYKNFDLSKFRAELREELKKTEEQGYFHFEMTFLRVLEKHAPMKQKVLRANDKPYMTKILRKAIMRRSTLKSKYLINKTDESFKEFKKQKNYTKRLAKRERTKYFANLDLNKYTDNIRFWNTVKPMFSSSSQGSNKITLVEKGEIITDDKELAETFNGFFIDAVSSLSIHENRALIDDVNDETDPVRKAVKKFQHHPSIIDIKKHVQVLEKFSFWGVDVKEMTSEINNLDAKKSGTFMNIPVNILKEAVDIVAEPLSQIWKVEIVQGRKFAGQLKLGDITPLHKKLENILKENYRPVSLLPVISKLFERLMQKQMKTFIEKFLSSFLCGYRKGYNTQYALLAMIEKWKKSLDGKGGYAGAILMDLSKAFDTINHELLIAKLEAYGFGDSALETMYSYLSDRWQRTKVNTSFSTWKELLSGVPQGSVLGPILFNIYLNDLFYQLVDVCNFADDTTLYACDTKLDNVLNQLEDNAHTAILWFENNYMKLNQSKCRGGSRSPVVDRVPGGGVLFFPRFFKNESTTTVVN
jgi:exonuclease III